MTGKSISLRQLMVMVFVGMFSPIVRVLPRKCAELSGKAAWLTPVVALIPICAYMTLMFWLFRRKNNGKGLAGMMIETFGRVAGSAVALLCMAHQVFYAGYIIRNSAERLVSTAYPDESFFVFAIALAAVCTIAAMGDIRSLARTAEIFFLLTIGTLVVVLLCSAKAVKPENLLPVSELDIVPVLKGSAVVSNLLSISIFALFLAGDVQFENKIAWRVIRWSAFTCVSALLIIIVTVGSYGAMIVTKTQQPFFVVVRDLKIFDILERVEAVVMAIWVVTDFVLLSLQFMTVAEILKTVFDTKKRKWFVPPAAVAACIISVIIAPNAFRLWNLTIDVMPRLNIVSAFIIIPAVLIVRRLKQAHEEDKKRGLTRGG